MSKGITISIIFQAQSLNYGEGIGNISELKKLTRGNGNQYTFASRQCLRYDVVRLGADLFNWNLQVVDSSKGTIQFRDNCSIKDSQEMDLFGYMKTSKKDEENKGGSLIRSAAVRLSNAISLEPYKNDIEILTNKGLADRINEHPNIANVEQHISYYTYTVTIDLDKIGIDKDIKLDNSERFNRLNQLLDILKILNRNIKGRQENLSPLFAIGGIYDIVNPFFLGRIKLNMKNENYYINMESIKNTIKMSIFGKDINNDTYAAIVDGIFANKQEIYNVFGDKLLSIESFYDRLKTEVKNYYGE